MRSSFFIFGFLASALNGTAVMAADSTSTLSTLQQQVSDGMTQARQSLTDTTNSASRIIPSLTPASTPGTQATKARAASSIGMTPPVQVAPAGTQTVAQPALVPATSSTKTTVIPTVNVNSSAAAPTTVLPAVSAAALPLPAPPMQSLVPPLPANDPSMLPSPNNAAANPAPAFPFSLPQEAAKATTSAAQTTPAPVVILPAVNAAAAAPEALKKHRRRSSSLASAKIHYRNIHMPATLAKKDFDRLNKHLPTARYESDLDQLLFVAVRRDDIGGVRALLDYSKRDINKQNAQGETPLMVAVRSNAFNVIRILLGRHADASIADMSGINALQAARNSGNMRVAHLLESMGGNTEVAAMTQGDRTSAPLQLIKPQVRSVN